MVGLFLILSYFIHSIRTNHKPINTMSRGVPHNLITTGNDIPGKIRFEALHLSYNRTAPLPVEDEIKEPYYHFEHLRNKFILDYSNEDPKNFRPDLTDYWLIASKRGFLFNFGAALLLILGLWVFLIRLAYGDCGGFKTIVRKPTKSDRYVVQVIGLIGFGLFFYGCFYTSYFILKDREVGNIVSTSLTNFHRKQINAVDTSMDFIKTTNKNHLTVPYSTMSLELFHIGNFLKPLQIEYVKSRSKGEFFAKQLYKNTNNSMAARYLMIVLTILGSLCLFGYAYKVRKILVSLGITFVLIFCMNINLNTIADVFNVWSINIDMCKQSLNAFEQEKGMIMNRNNNDFNEILTCLSYEGKENLSSQLYSFDVAKNAIHEIIRNSFIHSSMSLKINNSLQSAEALKINYEFVQQAIKTEFESDKATRSLLLKYLKLTEDMDKHYMDLAYLSRCQATIDWIDEVNYHVCENGIHYLYSLIWGFGILLLSSIFIAAAIFLSENIIRGLYNEEIQYVKTNKLRYDWN